MSCEFLPVYHPVAAEQRDPQLFANNVRAFMSRALRVPCTDHSYEDVILQNEALAHHLPPELAVVEFNKV